MMVNYFTATLSYIVLVMNVLYNDCGINCHVTMYLWMNTL